jgi:hypothetical protein
MYSRSELFLAGLIMALELASTSPSAQEKKPNLQFIIGDDIGWMRPSIYHGGLIVGRTPNIDRIGNEGGIFMFSRSSPLRVSIRRTIWVVG